MKDVSRSTLLSMQLDGHFLSTYYGEHAAREQTVRGGKEKQEAGWQRHGRAALQTEEDRCGSEDGVPHRARADTVPS